MPERSLRTNMGADRLDAVLWDMDGTLVDSEKLWTISLHDTARWLGGQLSPAARDAMVGVDMARTLVAHFDDLGLAADPVADGGGRAVDDGAHGRAVRGGPGVAAGRARSVAHGPRGRLAHGAGHQHRADPHGDGAGHHRARALLVRCAATRCRTASRTRSVPAGGGAARCGARASASRSRTRRPGRSRPSARARPCSSCPARWPVPHGSGARAAARSLVGLTRDDLRAATLDAHRSRAPALRWAAVQSRWRRWTRHRRRSPNDAPPSARDRSHLRRTT